jgi:glycosyl hydrolase family 99
MRSLSNHRALSRVLVLPLIALALLMVTSIAHPADVRAEPEPGFDTPRLTAIDTGRMPVFAYYYAWFRPTSWDRAKSDLPLLGAYGSDDAAVIAQHIRWAREAGINGFIVSWKHEPRLDAPLELLVDEARRQNFKLILMYEGLDFQRNPVPAPQVGADLQWFLATYGTNPVFDVWGQPAVIWSGTWKFSSADVAKVRDLLRAPSRILLLGSERSASDYAARDGLFDGDAYYWSSADPKQTPGYQQRLDDLAAAVHASGGRWIAPVVPGFDARLVGGSSVVSRRSGDTYRASWAGAISSGPSALGIISWNEFSENSHIEPSRSNQYAYLDLTAQLTGSPPFKPETQVLPNVIGPLANGPTDSSELGPAVATREQLLSWLVTAALLGAIFVSALRSRTRIA